MVCYTITIRNHLDMVVYLAEIANFGEKRIKITGTYWERLFWISYRASKNYTVESANKLFIESGDAQKVGEFYRKYPGADFKLGFPNAKVWKNRDNEWFLYFN